jgi:serine/threonine protein phosphatase PrpC
MFEIFAASIQGESHIKNNNKPCEDNSGVYENEVSCSNTIYHIALAVVADGHGGDKYFRSRFGSKLAVETAHEEINSFIEATAEKGIGFLIQPLELTPKKRRIIWSNLNAKLFQPGAKKF